MSFTEGEVAAVVEETAGSELAADASAAATTITIVDGSDFDDVVGAIGGLQIDGDNYFFAFPDEDDLETLTVSPGLTGAYLAGEPVLPFPLGAVERFAYVMTPEADEELVCRVPHHLYERLAVGTRDEYPDRENVIATLDDDEWVVSDVLDRSPTIDGAYVHSGEDSVPPGVIAQGVTASYVETDATITVTPEADGKLLVFWSAGVIMVADTSVDKLSVDVYLSLFVDGVQTGMERRVYINDIKFDGATVEMELPAGGTTAVEVVGGVEYVLSIAVKGTETTGQASVAAGKSGGLSYVAFGG